jgi:hypothetical protein
LRQRVALVATLARLYVGVVLIDRECRGHRRRIVGVVYDHMCQQQCDQRIGYGSELSSQKLKLSVDSGLQTGSAALLHLLQEALVAKMQLCWSGKSAISG